MTYRKFMVFNVVGGVLWVVGFLLLGYLFGNMPTVKRNFTLVILGIIIVSILPGVFEIVREWRRARKAAVEVRQPFQADRGAKEWNVLILVPAPPKRSAFVHKLN
jgi:hypothetical protein